MALGVLSFFTCFYLARVGLAAVKVQNMRLKHRLLSLSPRLSTLAGHACKAAQDARELLQSVAHFSKNATHTSPPLRPCIFPVPDGRILK